MNKSKNIYEPDYVKNLFNSMSGSYEKTNYITSFGFSIRWRKQFINKVDSSNQKLEIIDLLSGLGENWNYLKNKFPNSNLTALDFSNEMITSSKVKAQNLFKNSHLLLEEDVLNNNLPDNYFDILTSAYGLKTFNEEQLDLLAKQIQRILKPNGKFSFIEISKPKNKLLLTFYKFYLSKVIPILGKLFLGNPNDYKMLWIYTESFQDCRKAKDIFEKNGLQVNYEKYFFGCATGLNGIKL